MDSLLTIVFTADDQGAEDGVNVRKFKKGDVELLPEWFVNMFIDNGTAEIYAEGEEEKPAKPAKPAKGSKKHKEEE